MDFGFNDEYKMIQKMYREFAEKEIKPLAEEIDENERFPKESVQKMADNGMLGIPFPEEYGGEEGDYLSYVIAVEELSKVCASTGVTLSAHTSPVSYTHLVLLLGVFSICVAIGAPIGSAMGLASIITLLTTGMGFSMVPYNYYASLSKFLLLAIPFFILAGNIMEKAGISIKLIDFAQTFVGHIKGCLLYTSWMIASTLLERHFFSPLMTQCGNVWIPPAESL